MQARNHLLAKKLLCPYHIKQNPLELREDWMGFYAEPWLREARDKVRSVPEVIGGQNAALSDFDKLADAVEKAIKAALIENHGSLPRHHDHSQLVSMCRSTGVWDILPPALQGLVEEIESYRSKKAAAISNPISSGSADQSSVEQLQRYFFIARRLIDYMEFHVIGNDSVLKRLKVA